MSVEYTVCPALAVPLDWDNSHEQPLKWSWDCLVQGLLAPLLEVTVQQLWRWYILFPSLLPKPEVCPSVSPQSCAPRDPVPWPFPTPKQHRCTFRVPIPGSQVVQPEALAGFLARCLSHRMPDPDFSVNDVRLCVGKCPEPACTRLCGWDL